jgi:hypothetical protein
MKLYHGSYINELHEKRYFILVCIFEVEVVILPRIFEVKH